MSTNTLPVAVIGAGPVGLAAAAHLLSRGEPPVVLEAGATAGASIREWGHVRLFSPWRYVVDPASLALLEAAGWSAPPADDLPTGDDLLDRYLLPLAQLPPVAPHIQYNTRVVSVARQGFDKLKTSEREHAPFVIYVQRGNGAFDQILARAVIDASGTWTSPNPLGANGLLAIGETCVAEHIAYGIPDVLGDARERYAGKRLLVVGSGHSAFNALLDLAALAAEVPGTRITWAIRGGVAGDLYGGGQDDQLPARGALGSRLRALVDAGAIELAAGFRIAALHATSVGIEVEGEDRAIGPFDEIIAATGFRPNLSLTRELRLDLDAVVESPTALATLIDPNVHSCGTVPPHGFYELSHPEPDFYTVGMKSYGRAPTFLLLTGYEQVRSVTAALTGDHEAASRVELTLPETGVCSGPTGESAAEPVSACCGSTPAIIDVIDITATAASSAQAEASACCGGPAPASSDACCVLDAEAKAAGQSGCGCGSKESDTSFVPVTAGPRA
ncbi:MAG: FAD-dependent oxidoreductase [Dehalococcoidia bacterium]